MPEDLGDTPAIGTLTYKPSPALRETQAGIDPTELPRLLANAMPEGSWVAVTMRKPSNRERKFYTPWLGNRMGTAVPTHHSTSPTAVLVFSMEKVLVVRATEEGVTFPTAHHLLGLARSVHGPRSILVPPSRRDFLLDTECGAVPSPTPRSRVQTGRS